MSPAAWVLVFYGAVTFVGGIIGYVKAKSAASLLAGSIAGVLLLGCAYGVQQGHRVATIGGLLLAVVLGARFLGTWRRTHRVMPDLIMTLLSLAALLVLGLQAVTAR